MKAFNRFWQGLQTEAKSFLFFVILFTIFRIIFLGIFHNSLKEIAIQDILLTLWYGFRISLKTIGIICLISFVLATLPNIVIVKWPSRCIRHIWYSIVTVVMTVLFIARIPYYHIFESGYNIMLINGAHDDIHAIIDTAINEYHAVPYTIGALIICVMLVKLINRILNSQTIDWKIKNKRQLWIRTGVLVIALVVFSIFCRWGGAFSYNHSLNWENASRMSSNLLNETILDDGQALYRVQSIHKRMEQFRNITITVDELDKNIRYLGGQPSHTIDQSFTHTIKQAKLSEQPQTVTFILGESYGLWPMLEQYSSFGDYVAHEGKTLAKNGVAADYLIAQGSGTMPAVNGFLTGMPDVGLYPNYESVSYTEPYGMGIGSVMKGLGYKTVFWYGGFGAWQDVQKFALSQDFDEFHDASDIQYEGGNAWGAPDGALFKRIEAYMDEHKGEKIFNFVLTTTNHPPYSMDLAKEGFDKNQIVGKIPEDIGDTLDNIQEIGTYWYADHVMGQFVNHMQAKDPSSLFVITGDHSERFNFAREVSPMVRSTIPAIIYGRGVEKYWMPTHQFGTAIQLIPTLAQLVGQPGQTYQSMVPSLWEPTRFAFNHAVWTDGKEIQPINKDIPQDKLSWIEAMRNVAAWRMIKGNGIQ